MIEEKKIRNVIVGVHTKFGFR